MRKRLIWELAQHKHKHKKKKKNWLAKWLCGYNVCTLCRASECVCGQKRTREFQWIAWSIYYVIGLIIMWFRLQYWKPKTKTHAYDFMCVLNQDTRCFIHIQMESNRDKKKPKMFQCKSIFRWTITKMYAAHLPCTVAPKMFSANRKSNLISVSAKNEKKIYEYPSWTLNLLPNNGVFFFFSHRKCILVNAIRNGPLQCTYKCDSPMRKVFFQTHFSLLIWAIRNCGPCVRANMCARLWQISFKFRSFEFSPCFFSFTFLLDWARTNWNGIHILPVDNCQ